MGVRKGRVLDKCFHELFTVRMWKTFFPEKKMQKLATNQPIHWSDLK